MHLKFTLNIKPFSVNKMYCRDARFKSQEYKIWATTTNTAIQESDEYKQLLDIAEAHKANGGTFYVGLVYEYPAYMFYNKAGQISSKTVDCSNGAKSIIDIVFNDIMEVNDKHITCLKEEKRAGSNYLMHITIILNA